MEDKPSASKQIAILVPAKCMNDSSDVLKETTASAPENKISIPVPLEGTKDFLDVSNEITPSTPNRQITIPDRMDGTTSSMDGPKDGMNDEDTEEEELTSTPRKPKKAGLHIFFMNIRYHLVLLLLSILFTF